MRETGDGLVITKDEVQTTYYHYYHYYYKHYYYYSIDELTRRQSPQVCAATLRYR